MKKVFVTLMSIALMAMPAMAEEVMNPIITAMPSLSIAPDAHAGGLGDVGAATTPSIRSTGIQLSMRLWKAMVVSQPTTPLGSPSS